jgi:Subtilase family
MIRALLVALFIALLGAAPAAAEQVEITAQAKAVRADFLLKATPPGPAATICLVDTGVNVNPDTVGVIGRLALTGETSDQSTTLHGTQMAMFIGAPSNGFGMVGIWPAARILSVRANISGEESFTSVGYINGVKRCSDAAIAYGVKVVALPSSSALAFTPAEQEALVDEVSGARETGISFVAAAGNNGGGPVGTPANVPGVLSVGATDSASGGLCAFSATGALLLAPGCTLDGADPSTGAPATTQQGTSHAAVIAATALAALRTWRPDLTPDQADRLLNESASPSLWGRNLDVSAAFVAAGLGALVPPPPPAQPSPTPQPPPSPQVKQALVKPRITTRSRGQGAKRTLTVKASNRPRGARLTVRAYIRGHGGKLRRVASQTRRSSIVRIRIRTWRRVTARFSDPAGQYLQSPARIVTRR